MSSKRFNKLLKQNTLPIPGGDAGKYGKVLKIGAALAGAAPAMLDPEVTGARGSATMIGSSVDRAKAKRMGDATDLALQQKADAAAAAAAAEEPFTKSKQSQLDALKRKGRRASILTSPQGAGDPLGIPG